MLTKISFSYLCLILGRKEEHVASLCEFICIHSSSLFDFERIYGSLILSNNSPHFLSLSILNKYFEMYRKVEWLHHPYFNKILYFSIWYCLSSVFYRRLDDTIRLRQQIRVLVQPITCISLSFIFQKVQLWWKNIIWLVLSFLKRWVFFYLVIKLISRLKLYEKRQRDAKMLNVEIMEKLKLDLLKNIVVYEIELKHLDELACASTNHFNNISNNSSIPTIIFVSIPFFSLYKSKNNINFIRAKLT